MGAQSALQILYRRRGRSHSCRSWTRADGALRRLLLRLRHKVRPPFFAFPDRHSLRVHVSVCVFSALQSIAGTKV